MMKNTRSLICLIVMMGVCFILTCGCTSGETPAGDDRSSGDHADAIARF